MEAPDKAAPAGRVPTRGVSWRGARPLRWLGTAATLAAMAVSAAPAYGEPSAPPAHPGAGLAACPPSLPAGPARVPDGEENAPEAVIVECGSTSADPAALVSKLVPPGRVTDLGIVPGVAVTLPARVVDALHARGVLVTPDAPVSMQSSTSLAAGTCDPILGGSGNFPSDTGATQLAAATGDRGQGATVAVLDTGIDGALPDFANRLVGGVTLSPATGSPFTDQYGHGTFVAGLIAGNGASSNGVYVGEAPAANLVSIKVAGADGSTSISTIVQGINWAVKNRSKLDINVLNLSLGAQPTGPTATEPMDQAVEAAWAAGISVVVSAGNAGPFNGTVLTPGDDPLAITVGAYSDNDSTSPSKWSACPFSSVGPTAYDGWFKPDLVAPGRSVVSLADPGSTILNANLGSLIGTANFVGTGTSFSAAITSGAAALVVSAHPGVTPDDVKGRLLGNAMPADTGDPFVEGHGYLNAQYATQGPALVYSQNTAAAAESPNPTQPVSLAASYQGSSWNGSSWNGSSWNGSSWNGSSWNGGSWNGSSWNGSSWNGSSWNGSSWNGSSWNGSSWNGSSWNGSSWNGSSWNDMTWDGSSWNGSSWNGSSWNGSSWNGSSWNGSSWNGSSWNGSSWNGSSWNGSSWN